MSWRRLLRGALPPALSAVVVGVGWQLTYAAHVASPATLPAPIDCWRALRMLATTGRLWPSIGGSLGYGAVGFLLAVALGTPLGLLLARLPLARAALGPIVTGLQTLPSVAWVPVAVIWFHVTAGTKLFVVVMGAAPAVATGLLTGLDAMPPMFARMGHLLGASGLTLVRRVLLPAVLPAYIGGLRQGWAFAWRSLMAAEIISASFGHGLGALLAQARTSRSIAQSLAVIAIILALGIAVESLLFRPLERSVLRRRGLVTGAPVVLPGAGSSRALANPLST